MQCCCFTETWKCSHVQHSQSPDPGPGCVSPSLLCSARPGECELVNKIDQIDRKVQITFLCNLIKLQRSPALHTSVPYRAVRTPNTHIVTTIRSDKINLQISELNFILLKENRKQMVIPPAKMYYRHCILYCNFCISYFPICD